MIGNSLPHKTAHSISYSLVSRKVLSCIEANSFPITFTNVILNRLLHLPKIGLYNLSHITAFLKAIIIYFSVYILWAKHQKPLQWLLVWQGFKKLVTTLVIFKLPSSQAKLVSTSIKQKMGDNTYSPELIK